MTNNSSNPLEDLLKNHFEIEKIDIVIKLADLFSSNQYFSIKVGRYTVLVNAKKGYVISNDIDHLIDYISLIKSITTFDMMLNVSYLNDIEFNQLQKQADFMQTHTSCLNCVLWRIFDNVIESELPYSDHTLPLHLKFMPNVTALGHHLSKHALAVFSYSLMSPKAVLEIYETFAPYHIEKQDINRLLLLSVLSNFAHFPNIIKDPAKNEYKETNNTGIQKARKTGFLKRLIKSFLG